MIKYLFRDILCKTLFLKGKEVIDINMNPAALITGNITKGVTGGQSRGSASPADPLIFQKHLMAGGDTEQKQANGTLGSSGFSGVLNSIANLMNEVDQGKPSPQLSQTPENGVVEGSLNEKTGMQQGDATEETENGIVKNDQTMMAGNVITPEIPISMPVPQGENDDILLSPTVQGVASGSRGQLNLTQAENLITNPEIVAKAGKPDAIASQLILPEIKRTVAVGGKSVTEDLAAVTGQESPGVTKAQESLKIANIQQTTGIHSLLPEKDNSTASPMRIEGVPTAFSSSVTTVLKEIVTERQISSATSVIEKTVVEQLSNGMMKVSSREAGKVVIKLAPEHLGSVEVTLSKKNGQTMVRVVVDRSETLDIVRSDIRSLEKTLIESGVDVRSNSISLALKSSSGNTDSGGQTLNGNDRSIGHDISKRQEVSEIPRQIIEGRGGILNIRV
jgi:hypothetical protein